MKVLGDIQCAVTPERKYIVEVAQQEVVKVLPVKAPHNTFDSGSSPYIFASSTGDHAVNMIDLETMDYAASIPVGGAAPLCGHGRRAHDGRGAE